MLKIARLCVPRRTWRHFRGVLQVGGYAGFKRLAGDRSDDSIKLAFCWTHLRRLFYQFFESTKSPLTAHVLARIRELYAIAIQPFRKRV